MTLVVPIRFASASLQPMEKIVSERDLKDAVILKNTILHTEFGVPSKNEDDAIRQLSQWLTSIRSTLLAFRGQDNRIVATGGIFPAHIVHGSLFDPQDNQAIIKYLFVDKLFRNQTLGKQLLTQLELMAKKLGYKRLVLSTTNASAVALFLNNGFHTIKTAASTIKARQTLPKEVFLYKTFE